MQRTISWGNIWEHCSEQSIHYLFRGRNESASVSLRSVATECRLRGQIAHLEGFRILILLDSLRSLSTEKMNDQIARLGDLRFFLSADILAPLYWIFSIFDSFFPGRLGHAVKINLKSGDCPGAIQIFEHFYRGKLLILKSAAYLSLGY